MNQELIRDLEIFKDLPEHIKNACEYSKRNADKLEENKVNYRRFKRKLNEEIGKFEKQYRNTLNPEVYKKIINELDYTYLLSLAMVDIIEDAIDLNDINELNRLDDIVKQTQRLKYLSNLDINKILPSTQMAVSNNNQINQVNSQSRTNTETRNTGNTQRDNYQTNQIPPREPTLQEKLNNINHQIGDNYNVTVMETIINDDILNIDKQLMLLMNKPNQNFSDMQMISKLQKDKESLIKYLEAYQVNSHFTLDIREGQLNQIESRIDDLEGKRKLTINQENRSFLMRKIQKYNVERLTRRINELKQKRGVMLNKQRTVTVDKHNKFYRRASNVNNVTSFVETLGTEIKNIGIDIVSRFKSCKNNGTLNQRLNELNRKMCVLESSQPVYNSAQSYTR